MILREIYNNEDRDDNSDHLKLNEKMYRQRKDQGSASRQKQA